MAIAAVGQITWEEALASNNMRTINIAIARGLAPFESGSAEAANFIHGLFN